MKSNTFIYKLSKMLDKIKRVRKLAGNRSSRGGRGWTNNQSAAKKRKIDESNKFEATNVAAVMPVNEEVGEKRKSENVDENELPKAKKRKGFQQDIRIFVKQGVYDVTKHNINKIDSRNLTQTDPQDTEPADRNEDTNSVSELIPEITGTTKTDEGVATSEEGLPSEPGFGIGQILNNGLASCELRYGQEGVNIGSDVVNDIQGVHYPAEQSQEHGLGTARLDKGLAKLTWTYQNQILQL